MEKMLVNLSRIICVNLLCFVLCTPLFAQERQETSRAEECISIFNDVLRQVDVNYVDTLNYEDLTETAINAMLHKIDPYTVYYPKKNDRELRMLTTGKYGGIGAIIMQRDSVVVISEPYEGMPAAMNDIQAGDTLLEVDGMDCFKKNTRNKIRCFFS